MERPRRSQRPSRIGQLMGRPVANSTRGWSYDCLSAGIEQAAAHRESAFPGIGSPLLTAWRTGETFSTTAETLWRCLYATAPEAAADFAARFGRGLPHRVLDGHTVLVDPRTSTVRPTA